MQQCACVRCGAGTARGRHKCGWIKKFREIAAGLNVPPISVIWRRVIAGCSSSRGTGCLDKAYRTGFLSVGRYLVRPRYLHCCGHAAQQWSDCTTWIILHYGVLLHYGNQAALRRRSCTMVIRLYTAECCTTESGCTAVIKRHNGMLHYGIRWHYGDCDRLQHSCYGPVIKRHYAAKIKKFEQNLFLYLPFRND